MDTDEWIGTAYVPEGEELRLVRHDGDFSILLRDNELMSTLASASEEALATMTCERLGKRSDLQMLIGGYGMGFTLRAALDVLAVDAEVTVAELVPEIIDWARGPMAAFTAGCLDDPRVTLVDEDVAVLINAANSAYDAILLDVDNGPEGLTRRVNDRLYGRAGLHSAMAALRPGGVLAVWSATPEERFAKSLAEAGFEVSEEVVPARACGEGHTHVIWFAHKPAMAKAERLEELTPR